MKLPLTSSIKRQTSKSDELTHLESYSCIKPPGEGYKSEDPAKHVGLPAPSPSGSEPHDRSNVPARAGKDLSASLAPFASGDYCALNLSPLFPTSSHLCLITSTEETFLRQRTS